MTSNLTPNQTRSALFDNIRCLLIFLVLICHLFSSTYGVSINKQPMLAQWIYQATFLFHIPGFLIISGYFSKKVDKLRDTAVSKYLVPFLVFNLISSAIYLYNHGSAWYKLDILYPRWGLWFLLAMFIWNFFLKDLVRLRYALPLSFIIGLSCNKHIRAGKRYSLK